MRTAGEDSGVIGKNVIGDEFSNKSVVALAAVVGGDVKCLVIG